MRKLRKNKGFTLVELLVVIAIIGLLAGLVYTGFGGVFTNANVTKATTSGKNIYNSWASASSTAINKTNIYDWCSFFASKTKNNTASDWILDFDQRVQPIIAGGTSMPQSIAKYDANGKILAQNDSEFIQFPISWSMASYTKSFQNLQSDNHSDAPLIWSRGLSSTGTWDSSEAVFETGIGMMVFANGATKQLESMEDDNGEGILRNWKNPSQRTKDITQAIFNTATILKSTK